MADIVRPADVWADRDVPAETLLHHAEPEWEFRELVYGAGGSWDVVTPRLHIASHLDPLRQRLGPARAAFRTVAPSAAISAPGDHLAGAWEGAGRGQHVTVSPGFVAAAFERDMGAETVLKRHFAYQREPDTADTIIQHLLNCLSVDLLAGNPSGSVFLQTIVLAIVHHALRVPSTSVAVAPQPGGLSQRQLRIAMDLINEQLLGRPSLAEMAAALNVSTSYFCRAFRSSTGMSPHQYVIQQRVALARSLIETSTLSLSEVAQAAGFKDHSQMTATFRKALGMPPSHFRHSPRR
ncbi:helix-turn-helix transcriptional regulator [Methylobacterium nonmethylotrophicum]|uniref:AraC family transcriptional regulator n=1 Tax=Methylobacterium nonmethylotrophicum TaxID=1141884 RepID=A0A4Z0NGM1_9HYPH|nr:AraC family transcriptional regulator [Methylobacterium nonmethylotrophicum]TGD95362.1 AraC family transcriptional regulator [Methylobacterium nonmethylotrophicum]